MYVSKYDSDLATLSPSSPTSPPNHNQPLYYVQSPSRDSHDGDKSSSSVHAGGGGGSTDSPSHYSSYVRSLASSAATRFSFSAFRKAASGRSMRSGSSSHRPRNAAGRGWPECAVIQEEEEPYELGSFGGRRTAAAGDELSRRAQCVLGLMAVLAIFGLFCLIIWGASRPYTPQVTVMSLIVHNIYFGQGLDFSGVPTKLLTVNCSLKMNVYNPAPFFGIHVASFVNLMYSEIPVATGQLKYFQPRKSHRTVHVKVEGREVPLYGAGLGFAVSERKGRVPVKLLFEVQSRGDVVGALVRSKHRKHVSCSLILNSRLPETMKLKRHSCMRV